MFRTLSNTPALELRKMASKFIDSELNNKFNKKKKKCFKAAMALFQEVLGWHNTGILNTVKSVLVKFKLD